MRSANAELPHAFELNFERRSDPAAACEGVYALPVAQADEPKAVMLDLERPRSASKRLAIVRSRSTREAVTGSAKPFRAAGAMVSYSKRSPAKRRGRDVDDDCVGHRRGLQSRRQIWRFADDIEFLGFARANEIARRGRWRYRFGAGRTVRLTIDRRGSIKPGR